MNGALSAGTRVGPYRIEDRLGAGGMGTVYRAQDERLQRTVALKQITPKVLDSERAKKRFRREARAAARLNHPSIIHIHDYFESEDCQWIVMEHAEGETLSSLLKAGSLPLRRRIEIAAEIADALAAAHAEGIVHRDLKASNVLVTNSGNVKVLDFGLAKQIGNKSDQSTLTLEGQIVGTPHAMSPEQAMGQKVDYRSDLFSLGILLYEMVTGVSPFLADNPLGTISRLSRFQPPPIKNYIPSPPKRLSALIFQLLEKSPRHRPDSADKVAVPLRQIADALLSEELNAQEQIKVVDNDSDQPTPTGLRSERRQVTVLCFELISKRQKTKSEAQPTYAVTENLERLLRKTSRVFDGHIASLLGRRGTIYFGYPLAHEDAPRRAVNTALEIARQWADTTFFSAFDFKIALHTCIAVVLDSGGREQLALGEGLDLANALMQTTADREVWISAATYRVLKESFLTEKRSGLDGIETAYRLMIDDQVDSASWPVAIVASTPMVARTHELQLLLRCWKRVYRENGQAVLVRGEAGIGKSCLVQSYFMKLKGEDVRWLSMTASPYSKTSPFQPVIDLLRHLFDLEGSAEDPLGILESQLALYDLAAPEVVPLFANLLAVPLDNRYAPLGYSPQKLRADLLAALVTLLARLSKKCPIVVAVEDLHWLDQATLSLLDTLISDISRAPILLLMTSRPEFVNRWDSHRNLIEVNIPRLAKNDVTTLIQQVVGNKSLPQEVSEMIAEKTDGVPLFVEELTKNLLEAEHLVENEHAYTLDGDIEAVHIPATLRDSLTARLDRQGPAKQVAQVAAVIGREFSQQLLSEIADLEPGELVEALAQLMSSELIFSKGYAKKQRYIFKHALVQDTAYDSLLPHQRQSYHASIAETLTGKLQMITRSQPEVIAHHYTEAKITDRAIDYWQKAGQVAITRSADVEAKSHLRKGLHLLKDIPEGDHRDHLERDLQSSLGATLLAFEGFGTPESGEVHEKTVELCIKTGNAEGLIWALRNEWHHKVSRSLVKDAAATATRMLEIANGEDSPILSLAAYDCLSCSHYFMASYEKALLYHHKALTFDDHERDHPYSLTIDPGVENLGNMTITLWLMGYPDQALQCINRSERLGKRVSNSFSLSFAMFQRVTLYDLWNDYQALRVEAERCVDFSNKHGFPIWEALAGTVLAWAKIRCSLSRPNSDPEHCHTELQEIYRLIAEFKATGASLTLPLVLKNVIDANLRLERYDDAERAVEEALAITNRGEEIYMRPEILRLQGCLYLARGLKNGNPADGENNAENCFQNARDVARSQVAKSWELRCVMSLGRLWHSQGRTKEAVLALAEIRDWFTEGFGTPDLLEADRLLKSWHAAQ